MTKRRSLTGIERVCILMQQEGKCALCAKWLDGGKIEYDHSTPVALGNEDKPDQALCKPCHAHKTRKDVKAIAKAKRLHRTFVLGEKKAKRKIQSRGFCKRWSRRMNGEVVPREGAQP